MFVLHQLQIAFQVFVNHFKHALVMEYASPDFSVIEAYLEDLLVIVCLHSQPESLVVRTPIAYQEAATLPLIPVASKLHHL